MTEDFCKAHNKKSALMPCKNQEESLCLHQKKALATASAFFNQIHPYGWVKSAYVDEILASQGEIRLDGGWVDLISPNTKCSISPEGFAQRFHRANGAISLLRFRALSPSKRYLRDAFLLGAIIKERDSKQR